MPRIERVDIPLKDCLNRGIQRDIWGAVTAEIIPMEPDTVNAGEGKCSKYCRNMILLAFMPFNCTFGRTISPFCRILTGKGDFLFSKSFLAGW